MGRRLRRAGLKTRVVQLRKGNDFAVHTRRRTLDHPTDDGQELYREVLALLERAPPERPLRLTGVSAQDLGEPSTAQLGLFGEPPRRSEALNRTLDAITERFGRGAVAPADVLSLEGDDPLDELRAKAGASRLDPRES